MKNCILFLCFRNRYFFAMVIKTVTFSRTTSTPKKYTSIIGSVKLKIILWCPCYYGAISIRIFFLSVLGGVTGSSWSTIRAFLLVKLAVDRTTVYSLCDSHSSRQKIPNHLVSRHPANSMLYKLRRVQQRRMFLVRHKSVLYLYPSDIIHKSSVRLVGRTAKTGGLRRFM